MNSSSNKEETLLVLSSIIDLFLIRVVFHIVLVFIWIKLESDWSYFQLIAQLGNIFAYMHPAPCTNLWTSLNRTWSFCAQNPSARPVWLVGERGVALEKDWKRKRQIEVEEEKKFECHMSIKLQKHKHDQEWSVSLGEANQEKSQKHTTKKPSEVVVSRDQAPEPK